MSEEREYRYTVSFKTSSQKSEEAYDIMVRGDDRAEVLADAHMLREAVRKELRLEAVGFSDARVFPE